MSAMAPAADRYRDLLGAAEMFQNLPDHHLDRFLTEGRHRSLGPGEVLFRPGDPADRMWVLLDGVVEILRSTADDPEPVPVKYLSPGESLGDIGLFTGSPRTSTGRVPERAEVLTLDRPTFLRLAESIPGFGMHVARMFALRMERYTKQIRRQARRDLSGKVKYFDLPTVVQTLINTRHSGVLVLLDAEGETVGELLLVDGRVERACCDLLEGREAVLQAFLRAGITDFVVRAVAEPGPEEISDVAIDEAPMNLLLEALRQVDELARVRAAMSDPDRPYQARTKSLEWKEDSTRRTAQEVLAKLQRPRRLEDLVELVHCSRYVLYQVAARLHESGQIA
jgi:CRP-like cAMP-binding protein